MWISSVFPRADQIAVPSALLDNYDTAVVQFCQFWPTKLRSPPQVTPLRSSLASKKTQGWEQLSRWNQSDDQQTVSHRVWRHYETLWDAQCAESRRTRMKKTRKPCSADRGPFVVVKEQRGHKASWNRAWNGFMCWHCCQLPPTTDDQSFCLHGLKSAMTRRREQDMAISAHYHSILTRKFNSFWAGTNFSLP